MAQITENALTVKGKILEVFDQKEPGIKIICHPEWILLLIQGARKFRLKDNVVIEGIFKIKKVHKVEELPK